jgi:hypothetical protein
MTHPLSSMIVSPPRQPDLSLSADGDRCRRLIQKLPRKTQQVFLLSRLDQLSYTAIAQLLEMDVDSVERKMVRVLIQSSHSADETAEKALRWYAHLQSPLATPSQRIEFRHWLDADPRHLNAFQDAERLWRSLEAPTAIMGASGWHRRKRRVYIGWLMLTAFLCSLLVTAEAFT